MEGGNTDMKRKLAGLFTALMVLSLGTTAFAAGSVSSEDVIQQEKVDKAVEGAKNVSCETENVTASVPNMEDEAVAAKVNEAITEAGKKEGADVLAVIELEYDGDIPEGGVTITLSVPGVQANANIVLLHWDSVNNVWEEITPISVEDGKITAHFSSFSPVAIVEVAKAAEPEQPTTPEEPSKPEQPGQPNQPSTPNGPGQTPNNGPGQTPNNGPSTQTPEGKSPKTGAEASVLPILAVICAVGIAVCGKKVKVNA